MTEPATPPGGKQMKIEEVKITPAMAREWLGVSPERVQRTLRRRNIAKIVHAIEAGEWKMTHQPIALDATGFVLDGRHRLTAIGSQRKHVRSLVAWNADPATFSVIDTGAARSPGDSLKIAGYTDTNILAATTRQVLGYDLIVGTYSTLGSVTSSMTTFDVLTALEDPEIGKTILDSVAPGYVLSREIGRPGIRTPSTSLVAVVGIHSEHGPDTQREFFERLGDGANLDSVSPILALRNWVTSDSGYKNVGGTYRSTAFMANGIRAWNDYAGGIERRSLRYRRQGLDLMPKVS